MKRATGIIVILSLMAASGRFSMMFLELKLFGLE